MRFSTPLRYPGGKGKLTEFIKLVLIENNLLDGQYLEPYAGGAGIAINLLMGDYVQKIHLNDLNYCVYAFWHAVKHFPYELCRLIFDTEVTISEWEKQKNIHSNPHKYSITEVGFATFFLNRTNRSGILLGGVIGGKDQKGNWKIDARFKKQDLVARIEAIALRRDQIEIYNLDTLVLMEEVVKDLPLNTLVYLDPPYYVKGKGLYQNHYVHDDHVEIAQAVRQTLKHPWIVSYDHAPQITEMYEGSPSLIYGINYSAQNRYEGAEIMFFNESIVVPDIQNPSKLNSA